MTVPIVPYTGSATPLPTPAPSTKPVVAAVAAVGAPKTATTVVTAVAAGSTGTTVGDLTASLGKMFAALDRWVIVYPRRVAYTALVVMIAMAAWHFTHPVTKTTTVVQTTTQTKTITIPGPLTTKTLTKTVLVPDTASASALLKDNQTLKLTVQQLNETMATLQSSGDGTVQTVPTTTIPKDLVPSGPATPTVVEFKDWRLHFVQNGQDAKYDLSQKFEVIDTVGKNAKGIPTNLYRVYEMDATGKPVPLTDVTTTTVVSAGPGSHFYLQPSLAVGVGLVGSAAATTQTNSQAILIGIPWLKRGATTAAQDTRYELLTPVFVKTTGETGEIGLLPFSINLGSLPHQPFQNIWISPYVGLPIGAVVMVKRIGFFVHFGM